MTLAPVDVEVTPHPEILYQAADPRQVRKARVGRWVSVALFAPPVMLAVLVVIGFSLQPGQSSATRLGAAIVLSAILLAISAVSAVVTLALTRPTPPPAITKDGVLLYSWIPFLARSPVERRFGAQRTVKGYRAGQYTVIELYPPNGRWTNVPVFDPDERALKIVREAVLKSGSKMGDDGA